jgi:glycosyltransferase involved in cell wall biosynthesis
VASPACGARARREATPGRPGTWLRAQLDERLEAEWARRWLPAATRCVVPTEADRLALAEHVAFDRIDVVPFGIDTGLYAPRSAGERGRLLFVGALDRPPHLEAARRLAGRVLPRVRAAVPHAELVIAGGGPSSTLRALAALPGVRVTGAPPDLRPTLWSAAVALVPDEAGPGVDAALLEAMALGTPVVTARRCLSGFEHVLAGQHVLVAEDDAETAAAATRLLREPVVAATLAANARDLVQRRYTWAAVARSYESLWANVAAPRPVAVAA